MNPNIYNRPMFQNPQQRAGGGIMAGVAPINMSNGGDPNDTWAKAIPSFFGEQYKDAKYLYDQLPDMPTPSEAGRMYDEGINVDDLYGEGNFFSLDKTEAGSGMNLRDITDVLIVDPEDPVDLAIAASAVGMLAAPPGLIGVGLAKLGYTGVKIKRVLQRVAGLQKKLGDDELKNIQGSGLSGKLEERAREMGANPIDNLKRDSDVAGFAQNRFAPTTLGQYETTRFLSLPAQEAYDKINFISPAQASEAPYPKIPEYEGGPVETPAGIAAIETKDPKIDTLVREAETDAEGGIAKVARSIAEARSDEFKSPTFRRGDKDLAAVTKEDLIDAGYEGPDALTNYLNDMKFDDELGEYIKDIEAKGKADGGVVGLWTGGAAAVQRGLAAARAARLAAANKVNPPWSKQALDGQMDARRGGPPASPDMPAGGKVTDDVNVKTGNIFSRNPKTTLGTIAGGLYAADAFLKPDEEEVAGPSSGGGSGSSVIEEEPAFTQVDGKNQPAPFPINPNKDLITKTTDYLKGSLSKLKDQYASDPRKGLFIAGQLMKAREGIVPINGITALTEAEMQYENLIAEEKSKGNDGKPPLFQMYDAIVEEQIALGNPMSEKVKQEVLASLFDATRSNEFMSTLFKGIALNPQLLAEGKITDVITKTAIDAGGDIGALLTAHGNNRPST